MRTYSIVGMNYIKTEGVVAALEVGTPLVLVREPNNTHDKNAVAVWANGRRIGYIPKAQNLVLAQFIDQQGRPWTSSVLEQGLGMDGTPDFRKAKAVDATFVRSPNSKYPMAEV